MTRQERLQRVLLHIVFLSFNVATLFGLSTFYYSETHKSFVDSKFLSRYCKFMGLAFFFLYPSSVLFHLVDLKADSVGVTDLARNSVLIGNWLMCTMICFNQTSYSVESCSLYNQAVALYVDIAGNQCKTFHNDGDINFKLNLSAKCVLKTCFLAFGFLFVNIGKYCYRIESRMSLFELVLFIYLFVPSFIMILASNRFYVATTFCLYLIMRINNGITAVDEGYRGLSKMRKVSVFSRKINLSRTVADEINISARNYAKLHQLFIDFSAIYVKYILFILGFCFTNIVFEVI